MHAILFDLDETLVAQEQAFLAAYRDAGIAATEAAPVVDAAAFARDLPAVAHEVFCASPIYAAVRRCCFGGRDVLWGDTSGDSPTLCQIAGAAPEYRAAVWQTVLHRHGVADPELAQRLQERFTATMLRQMAAFAEVRVTLENLAGQARLGILTNGMPGAQGAKLRHLGLDRYFDVVVASASVEVGKPAREIFEHALDRLQVSPQEAVMVGDSLEGDIRGAARVGLRTVWVNRQRAGAAASPTDGCSAELPDLAALPSLLRGTLREPASRIER
jgi:putative hydrolase of the HAD superfamily